MRMGKRLLLQKITRLEKLSRGEQEDLIRDLLAAFQIIRDPDEVLQFIQDLFTRKEVAFFSKRLRIAKLLLEEKTYEEITQTVHTSHATVAKVAAWLSQKGEGFRNVIHKLPKREENVDDSLAKAEWQNLMRRYPGYFWPQLLIKEIGKHLDAHKQQQLTQILTTLDDKRSLHKELEDIHSAPFKSKRKKYSTT